MIRRVVVAMAVVACNLVVVSVGCGVAKPSPEPATSTPEEAGADDPSVLYPNLNALYQGNIGMYRTCGPNNAVCHNSREFPNFATLGSLVEDIGLPCNQDRTTPTEMHDLCERPGDELLIGSTPIEIAWFENADPAHPHDDLGARQWRVVLHDTPPPVDAQRVAIVRRSATELQALTDDGVTASNDTAHGGKAVMLQLPTSSAGGIDVGATVAQSLASAGVPGDPASIQEGDPNRNGVFGATLGGALIKPGDAAKSYLFTRLTDPDAGALMPRANCCFWSKTSLRALWCWVASLRPDGSNALGAIDYARCPVGPPGTVVYPTQGPNCSTSGLCPVQPRGKLTDEPTWTNIYPNVIQIACTSCHSGGAAAQGGLDMGSSDLALQNLLQNGRVVPHDARASRLYQKISPDLCKGDCMPRGGQPLDPMAIDLIGTWIDQGAKSP
jgi:hypothetical protein